MNGSNVLAVSRCKLCFKYYNTLLVKQFAFIVILHKNIKSFFHCNKHINLTGKIIIVNRYTV